MRSTAATLESRRRGVNQMTQSLTPSVARQTIVRAVNFLTRIRNHCAPDGPTISCTADPCGDGGTGGVERGVSAELRVEVDDSVVYEVLLGLYAHTRPDELLTDEPDEPRLGPRRPASAGRLERALDRLGGRYCPWDQLLGLAAQLRARSIARFIDQIQQTEPEELLVHLLGFHAEPFPPHIRAVISDAAGGSRSARKAVLDRMARDDQPRRAAMGRLFEIPSAELPELIGLSVRRWYEEVFQPDEERVVALLAADASAKRALSTTSPELLIRVTTGVRYVRRPWVESVLLIPSVVLGPWLLAVDYRRSRIYCYSVVEDTPSSPTMPPPPVVRMYHALGNATRLRIIKSLAACPMTLGQLCRELDAPEPALRPHLALLRAARLVWITCATEMTYELRDDVLATAGHPLLAYLDPTGNFFPA